MTVNLAVTVSLVSDARRWGQDDGSLVGFRRNSRNSLAFEFRTRGCVTRSSEDRKASYGLTHLPFAFDDFTAASTKARPLTPSSMVGKWTPFGGFLPVRAALIAAATSE